MSDLEAYMSKMIKNDEGILSRNQKSLESFAEYCISHPQEKFWQAVRNWSDTPFILKADSVDFENDEISYNNIRDTFYEE